MKNLIKSSLATLAILVIVGSLGLSLNTNAANCPSQCKSSCKSEVTCCCVNCDCENCDCNAGSCK